MSRDRPPEKVGRAGTTKHGQGQPPTKLSNKTVLSKSPCRTQGNSRAGQVGQEISYIADREIRGGHTPPKPPNPCPRTRARACPVQERDTENALTAATKASGGLCWKFTSPGTDGVPDRIVILPGGHIGFVEVKTTGAKPRPLQVRRLTQLDDLGVPVFVIDHPDQIEGVLDAIRSA